MCLGVDDFSGFVAGLVADIDPPRYRNLIAFSNLLNALDEYGNGEMAMENVDICIRTYFFFTVFSFISTMFTSVASAKLMTPFSAFFVMEVGSLLDCFKCFWLKLAAPFWVWKNTSARAIDKKKKRRPMFNKLVPFFAR